MYIIKGGYSQRLKLEITTSEGNIKSHSRIKQQHYSTTLQLHSSRLTRLRLPCKLRQSQMNGSIKRAFKIRVTPSF